MSNMKQQVARAIRLVQHQIRWKPNSAERHLRKRKNMGHLSDEATLEDYEQLISMVVNNETAKVYLFWYHQISYVAVITTVQDSVWLVMFGLDGLMETAFMIDMPNYLEESNYQEVGLLKEVVNDE